MDLQAIYERLDWAKSWIGNCIHAKINNSFGGNMRVLSFDEFLHCKGLYQLVLDNTGFIPPMIDPMGKYWIQPHHNQITFRNGYAEMNKYCFDLLSEYSHSYPTGKYAGKMWKRLTPEGDYLVWYGHHENPELLSINYMQINIVDPNFLYMYDSKRTLIVKGEVDDFDYYVNLQKKQQENLLKVHYSKQV